MRLKKTEDLHKGDGMRDIAIVTGVLVLQPVGEVNEEEIADDAIFPHEKLPEDWSGE